jgi:hypothetical protein
MVLQYIDIKMDDWCLTAHQQSQILYIDNFVHGASMIDYDLKKFRISLAMLWFQYIKIKISQDLFKEFIYGNSRSRVHENKFQKLKILRFA